MLKTSVNQNNLPWYHRYWYLGCFSLLSKILCSIYVPMCWLNASSNFLLLLVGSEKLLLTRCTCLLINFLLQLSWFYDSKGKPLFICLTVERWHNVCDQFIRERERFSLEHSSACQSYFGNQTGCKQVIVTLWSKWICINFKSCDPSESIHVEWRVHAKWIIVIISRTVVSEVVKYYL